MTWSVICRAGVCPDDYSRPVLAAPKSMSTASPGRHAQDQIGPGHERYDTQTLRRATSMGIDAADERMDRIMPRWFMTERDWQDLIAYLRQASLSPSVQSSNACVPRSPVGSFAASPATHKLAPVRIRLPAQSNAFRWRDEPGYGSASANHPAPRRQNRCGFDRRD